MFQFSHDPRLLAVSIVVGALASYVAFDMADRATQSEPWLGRVWIGGSGLFLGAAIWSSHFLGLLAVRPPAAPTAVPWGYDPPEVLGTLILAVCLCMPVLAVAYGPGRAARRILVATLGMAATIACTHRLSEGALRGIQLSHDRSQPFVLAALAYIALLAATFALLQLRPARAARSLGQMLTGEARLMGAATITSFSISGLHWSDMTRERITLRNGAEVAAAHYVLPQIGVAGLGVTVTFTVLILVAAALIGRALEKAAQRRMLEQRQAGEARYRRLTQSASDAIVTVDIRGVITSWNPSAERSFGWTEAEILGRHMTELMPEQYRQFHTRGMGRFVGKARGPALVEFTALRRDGSSFPMEIALSEWSDDGETFFTAFIRDITERKRVESKLRESALRYRTLVEQSPEAIVIHADGVLLYANPAAARLIGAESASAVWGLPILALIHPDSHDVVSRALLGPSHRSTEPLACRLLKSDGRALDVETVSVAVTFAGRPSVQTHLHDVTERKALESQLAHQAFHDALTGLANRALFRDRVEHALSLSARRGTTAAVLFLDLDNFKAVNDVLGHQAGDALLRTIAARLRGAMRAPDTCARLGGDEFAVLLEDPGRQTDTASYAAHVAERLLDVFRNPCTVDGAAYAVSASIGIAIATPDDTTDTLLRNADLAMYRAKSGSKARYELFEPAMHQAVRERLALETDLRRAVDELPDPSTPSSHSQFVLYYQPIASLDDGVIQGYEALVRWKHPVRGIVQPSEFIPVAEETGLIVPLGRWIMREACQQGRKWQDDAGSTHPPMMSINLSARQIQQPDLRHDVVAALSASGFDARYLTLEMTETVLFDNSPSTLDRLSAIRALGVRLAIDDFGTGYSSLAYLERFPVDVLKIDKQFVDRIATPSHDSPLAHVILSLGRELGIRVVAEGIEREAQWDRLREWGCELGQGYLIARPLPGELLTPPAARLAMSA